MIVYSIWFLKLHNGSQYWSGFNPKWVEHRVEGELSHIFCASLFGALFHFQMIPVSTLICLFLGCGITY